MRKGHRDISHDEAKAIAQKGLHEDGLVDENVSILARTHATDVVVVGRKEC